MTRYLAAAIVLASIAAPAASATTPPSGTLITIGGPPPSVYAVDPSTGHRTLLSTLSDATQGQKISPYRLATGPGGAIYVTGLNPDVTDDGLLVKVDAATGHRTLVSNFQNTAQGPVGYTPFGAAVEPDGSVLVTDRGVGGGGNSAAVWRVKNGVRTKLTAVGGGSPEGVALDAAGHIYVADAEQGSDCTGNGDHCGALYRVESNGQRTVVSDFGNPAQGPTGIDPVGLALDTDGSFLVIDEFAGGCGCGELFRVDPSTGHRTVVSDFGNVAQGPTGGARPKAVVVRANGAILTDGCPGTGNGAMCKIDRTTGDRTNFGDFGPLGTLAIYRAPPNNVTTTITSGPTGKTSSAPQFAFTSNVAGATFACRFDSEPLAPCSSPRVRYGLAYGKHTFFVRAKSPGGAVDPVGASRSFDLEPGTRAFGCTLDAAIPIPAGALFGKVECDLHGTCPPLSRCTIAAAKIDITDKKRLGRGWVNLSTCLQQSGKKAPSCYGSGTGNTSTFGTCYFPNAAGPWPACPDKESVPASSLLPPISGFFAPCQLQQTQASNVSGFVTCSVTMRVVPVHPLVLSGGLGGNVGVFAPAGGKLGVSPAGAAKHWVVREARKRSRPAFKALHATLGHAGWVRRHLKLSPKTKASLRRHHKLRLRVTVTFTPRGGRRTTRHERLTLALPTCYRVVAPKHPKGGRVVPLRRPCKAKL